MASEPVPSVPLGLFGQAHNEVIESRYHKILLISSPLPCPISFKTAARYSKRT